MKPKVYEQMQKRCSLYSIEGWRIGGLENTKRNFNGHFLHVPGPNSIVGGNIKHYWLDDPSIIEKGFMNIREMWIKEKDIFEALKIAISHRYTFHRDGDIWVGRYSRNKREEGNPTEAKTELIDDAPFPELAEEYKDIIDAFGLQLPE